jgi:hypothetical protein
MKELLLNILFTMMFSQKLLMVFNLNYSILSFMKKSFRKLFCTIAIIAGVALMANAQEVGIRFGGTNGAGGAAIDGIFGVGELSRIHADLGFYSGGVGIDALWDFLNQPLGSEAFNWYLGVGPSLYIGNDFQFGASGEIGLEYHFLEVPIAIGIDWRPTLWITDTRFGADSFGLNVRYVFGK